MGTTTFSTVTHDMATEPATAFTHDMATGTDLDTLANRVKIRKVAKPTKKDVLTSSSSLSSSSSFSSSESSSSGILPLTNNSKIKYIYCI